MSLCLVATGASAQFMGGSPLPFSAPEAAAVGAGAAQGATNGQNCYLEPHGRGGSQTQCPYQPSPPPPPNK